jgi:hypothetical protein
VEAETADPSSTVWIFRIPNPRLPIDQTVRILQRMTPEVAHLGRQRCRSGMVDDRLFPKQSGKRAKRPSHYVFDRPPQDLRCDPIVHYSQIF